MRASSRLTSPFAGNDMAEGTPASAMQSSADDVLLQQALDATRAELERPSTSEHAKAWLPAYLGSGEGMRQLYGLLAQHCGRDAFLAQLARARSMVARPDDVGDGLAEPHNPNNAICGEVSFLLATQPKQLQLAAHTPCEPTAVAFHCFPHRLRLNKTRGAILYFA